MDDPGKGFTDLWKIVVDPAMHPGGKEREALKESIHVRIVAAIRIEQEPPRNFWILARKLAAHLA
jgi:hypothetical protein